jgi:hypothetical protein
VILDGLDEANEPPSCAFFIDRLAQNLTSVRLVLGSRSIPDTSRLQNTGRFQTFILGDLTQQESTNFLRQRLGAHDVPPEALDTIASMANGNPLMLSVLASAFSEKGLVTPARFGCGEDTTA